jgi:hypothetical protein
MKTTGGGSEPPQAVRRRHKMSEVLFMLVANL